MSGFIKLSRSSWLASWCWIDSSIDEKALVLFIPIKGERASISSHEKIVQRSIISPNTSKIKALDGRLIFLKIKDNGQPKTCLFICDFTVMADVKIKLILFNLY